MTPVPIRRICQPWEGYGLTLGGHGSELATIGRYHIAGSIWRMLELD